MREIAVSECLQAQCQKWALLQSLPVITEANLLLLEWSMNVMVAVSWHTFPAQSCHIGTAPGRSGDILKARPRQPRTHRAWRQSPRCTGVARLVASLKGKVRQYNNNDTTGDRRTADCHKHAPSPCDSDSNSLLIVSCVWTLVSMMVTWCLQQV